MDSVSSFNEGSIRLIQTVSPNCYYFLNDLLKRPAMGWVTQLTGRNLSIGRDFGLSSQSRLHAHMMLLFYVVMKTCSLLTILSIMIKKQVILSH